MLTITDHYTGTLPYPMEKLGESAGLLFFDIETTGLSAKTSQLYLIGCLFTDGTEFHLHQWFAERPADEPQVLTAFREYLDTLPEGCLLLHFNGNGFDIPYLRQKYERYQKPFPLDTFEGMDIYRALRPYKCVLGLPSLRQKTIEDYLGITRKDPFDGGQLIAVYEDYVDTHSKFGLKALLLHNDEDVRNMPKLLAALHLSDYMEANYSLSSQKLHCTTNLDGSERTELLVTLQSDIALPHPISIRMDNGLYLTASGNRISLAAPLPNLTLKHFFANTKDYFYLPDEDRAIHKSVGIYVDKEHRAKATKDNCYAKKTGVFLPCPAGMDLELIHWEEMENRIFRQERKDKDFYLEWNAEEESNIPCECANAFWSELVHAIWRSRR